MYRYHPQLIKIIDFIKNSTIGYLVPMKFYFGMNSIYNISEMLFLVKIAKLNILYVINYV